MLIVNDEQRLQAGIRSLSKRCSYCSEALAAYPLILSDDAGLYVYHAACAAALATEIVVDLYTFFRPTAPSEKARYQRFRCRNTVNNGNYPQVLLSSILIPQICFTKRLHSGSGLAIDHNTTWQPSLTEENSGP